MKDDNKLDCMNEIETRYREVANSDLIPDGDRVSNDETIAHIRFSDVTEGLLLRCEHYVRAELALTIRERDLARRKLDAASEGLQVIDECLHSMHKAFRACDTPKELIALVDAMSSLAAGLTRLTCDPDEKESAIARYERAVAELRPLAVWHAEDEPVEQSDDTSSKE